VEEHPTNEDFARFLQQSAHPSSANRNALVVRHLLAGCSLCHQALRDLPGGAQVLSHTLGRAVPTNEKSSKGPNYDWAFARANRALSSLISGKSRSPRIPEQLVTLSGLSEGEQLRLIKEDERFSDPELINCLIERAHATRYQSPRKTLHFARLAYHGAEVCRPERVGGQAQLIDLRVGAQGAYANALRICGNLQEAEVIFSGALRLCSAENGSPQVRANLLSQLAALRIFQRRLEEALSLIEEAFAICQGLEEPNLRARLMVQKAIAVLYSGEAERAASIVQKAIPLIDRDEDALLFLAAHHNLARCNIDLNRPEEALALTFEIRELYRECEDPLILLRVLWQEGQLLREVGHLRSAESALLRARQGFGEHGLAYEAAMVCLDLAEVYSKLGQTDKLRRTIAEALPIFKAFQVDREVLASLIRLQQSAEDTEPD
jgi:tetratricopeptide (TPR) repeat protein